MHQHVACLNTRTAAQTINYSHSQDIQYCALSKRYNILKTLKYLLLVATNSSADNNKQIWKSSRKMWKIMFTKDWGKEASWCKWCNIWVQASKRRIACKWGQVKTVRLSSGGFFQQPSPAVEKECTCLALWGEGFQFNSSSVLLGQDLLLEVLREGCCGGHPLYTHPKEEKQMDIVLK